MLTLEQERMMFGVTLVEWKAQVENWLDWNDPQSLMAYAMSRLSDAQEEMRFSQESARQSINQAKYLIRLALDRIQEAK